MTARDFMVDATRPHLSDLLLLCWPQSALGQRRDTVEEKRERRKGGRRGWRFAPASKCLQGRQGNPPRTAVGSPQSRGDGTGLAPQRRPGKEPTKALCSGTFVDCPVSTRGVRRAQPSRWRSPAGGSFRGRGRKPAKIVTAPRPSATRPECRHLSSRHCH